MIFSHTWPQVLDGSKTQTRRLVKPGEILVRPYHDSRDGVADSRHVTLDGFRIKWIVGRTYAVQPGRGQKAVGRIRITSIRQERLQEMPIEDVPREGIPAYTVARGILSENRPDTRWKYIELWDSIHTTPGTRWSDNPLVWVLSFELAGAVR